MKYKSSSILNQRNYPIIALGITWLFMQCFFLWKNGIVTNQEAIKYINEANHFLETGTFSTGNFLFYSTQILLIAFCIKIKTHFLFIVILQILINGVSIICFYKIVKNISQNKWVAWFSTFYFLIFYYYHLFNTYLFTESLFFSFSVIYTYFLFSLKKITLKKGIFIFLFLTLLYVTRPTGIFFIPATYLFLIIKFYPKYAFKIIAVSSIFALAGLFFLFNFSLGSGGEFDFLLPYLDERIICGVSTISNAHHISIPVEKNSIQGLFYIITHHFDLFFSLSIKRLAAFFGVSRTYYSLFHNIFISVYFYLIYLIILIGIKNLLKKNKAEVWFLITNIAFMAITVAFSCDEWNNRFLFSVLPCFLLLAVISINNSKNKINAGKSYN
jgi:hypothetical protein